jgi:hypothetical protein
MEDANGDLTGRMALYLDSTTTGGFDDARGISLGSATRMYELATQSSSRIGTTGSAAMRYCEQWLHDASPGTVRSFSPAPDEADHNLPSLSDIAPLHARKAAL